MRYLLAGDIHGDAEMLRVACETANRQQCAAVLQLGDFGFYWPHRPEMVGLAKQVVKETGARVIFIDGNHDWHEGILADHPAQNLHITDVAPGELRYLARGRVLDSGYGPPILGMGGGGSVDRNRRTEGKTWFATEYNTPDDLHQTMINLSGMQRPVMLTHDCPALLDDLLPAITWAPDALADAAVSRDHLNRCIAYARPIMVIHGHMHYCATYAAGGVPVKALAHAQSGIRNQWMAILNITPEWAFIQELPNDVPYLQWSDETVIRGDVLPERLRPDDYRAQS